MAIAQQTTVAAVRTLVVQHLNLALPEGRPTEQDDLWKLGMTSLSCLGLMLAIEDEFDIELAQDALKEATFQNLATISAAVDAVLV
ncbi:phosphopantetheine-binding protein [Catenulispora pinisilvae]|uniref:phosphopantetheine-binding protein n=1 Tax=Catenulispora pinisilvae TaxID=2705253 RepID=UPI001890DA5A|nr:phosphopantetheine-binding protein [Catenulispora pinisilvae]